MFSPALVAAIEQLLAQGKLTQRQIADRLGISRSSVSNIATGRRLAPAASPEPNEVEEVLLAVRCPGCGGRVYPPCRLCAVRAIQAKKRHAARRRASWTRGLAAGRASGRRLA